MDYFMEKLMRWVMLVIHQFIIIIKHTSHHIMYTMVRVHIICDTQASLTIETLKKPYLDLYSYTQKK